MRKLLGLLTVGVMLTLLAACGATKTVTVTTQPPATSPRAAAPAINQPAACTQPAHDGQGGGFMGCAVPKLAPPRLALGTAPAGRYFPDVSSWQGHPNWDAAKPHIVAAVAKLGEYTLDPDVAYNVAAFKRLNIPYAVYWFVRPSGCVHEGALIESYAKQFGVKLVVLDEETSGISGYAACLDPYVVNATGRHADVYRSSGNNFDSSAGNLACWVAAYGPSAPPTCGGRPVVAFQFTDGRFGYPIYIPGIGQGDVSVDYKMFAAPIPPKPKPKPKPVDPYAKAPNVVRYFGHDHAREHNTLKTWAARACSNPAKRPVCVSTRRHALLLQGRIYRVAHRHHPPAWARDDLGVRYQYFSAQLAGK